MLESLMKFGAHKVNYFEPKIQMNPRSFGFYVRAELRSGEAISRSAKYQLQAGLAVISAKNEMQNLAGIYMDVDVLSNPQRPAFLQMKQDMITGLFRRLFVMDSSSLLGEPGADEDLIRLFELVGGFELFTCSQGECVPVRFLPDWISLAV
jgi:hypothetical protein